MGVIYKLLYRGEVLNEPRHRNLFLDMEENIHIHLRDLRIELSRSEFEDIVRTFSVQSAELMGIIEERDYKDGVLPNSNVDSVTLWTQSRLPNPVVYHPRRISIEECTDGFHLHFRNYKILLDRDEFKTLVDAFKSIDLDAPYASTPKEILTLLDVNHVHYLVKNSSSGAKDQNVKTIIVAKYHEPKIRGIFTEIGMERHVDGAAQHYSKGGVVFHVSFSNDRELFVGKMATVDRSVLPLVEYLSQGQPIDVDKLNGLKAKVLDTFLFVEKSGQATSINLDYKSWIYDPVKNEIVFPFDASANKPDTKALYQAWTNFLRTREMYFVKPTKIVSGEERQKELHKLVMDKIATEIETIPAVAKIYLMGSAIRGDMGLYSRPFIHSRWAKIGSDIDLLIEIDEEVGTDFPETWNYINVSANKCDIYHIGEIDAEDDFGQRERYPNIDFFQHLLDAYVYIPSKADAETKDAFLKKHKAELVFDRGNGVGQNKVQATLEQAFGSDVKGLARLDVATENELYGVDVNGRPAILKVYKVSGNYSSKRLVEHTEYESQVINMVDQRGVPTASIIPTIDGKSVFMVDDSAAILFGRMDGVEGDEPDFPVKEAATALAGYHKAQIDNPIEIDADFSFDQVFKMWQKEFHRFAGESKEDKELAQCFSKLEAIYDDLEKTYTDLTSNKKLLWLHNHGDVTPRNVYLDGDETYLFDFQNSFFGPRLFDLVDGGIEFSWGIRNAKLNDFERFDQFIAAYTRKLKLPATEKKDLDKAIKIVGLIKFIKEVRMIKGSKNKNNLRRVRALDLAKFLETRVLTKKRSR